jgi:hypothetical protein
LTKGLGRLILDPGFRTFVAGFVKTERLVLNHFTGLDSRFGRNLQFEKAAPGLKKFLF